MATMITSECINCGACEPECPNTAIYQGGVEWQALDGAMHPALSNDIFYIVPEKCTECVGFHDHEACAAVCPVDCCVPNPDIPETHEVLLARARDDPSGQDDPRRRAVALQEGRRRRGAGGGRIRGGRRSPPRRRRRPRPRRRRPRRPRRCAAPRAGRGARAGSRSRSRRRRRAPRGASRASCRSSSTSCWPRSSARRRRRPRSLAGRAGAPGARVGQGVLGALPAGVEAQARGGGRRPPLLRRARSPPRPTSS